MSSIANHHTGGGLHLPRRVAGGGGQDCGARGASIYTGMDRELVDKQIKDFCVQGPLIFNPKKKEEIWRFLTYMFVHSGYFHIVFNVLIQVSRSFSLTYV